MMQLQVLSGNICAIAIDIYSHLIMCSARKMSCQDLDSLDRMLFQQLFTRPCLRQAWLSLQNAASCRPCLS